MLDIPSPDETVLIFAFIGLIYGLHYLLETPNG